MKNILEKLYYKEMEDNPQLSPERKSPQYKAQQEAFDEFFGTLSKEQKRLYLVYEAIHNKWLHEENARLYQCAFSSGFSLSNELHEAKDK